MGQTEGWHEVLHDRQIEPLHHFPGDDTTPEEYTAAMYNWYSEKLSMFQAGAEACGLELRPDNLERGRRVVAASCWLDEYLDQPSPRHEERVRLFTMAVQSARLGRVRGWSRDIDTDDPELAPRPELRHAMRLMENATDTTAGFHPDLRKRSLLHAMLIGNAALRKPEITDRTMYAKQLVQESDATAHIMAQAFLDRPPTSPPEVQWARVMRKCMRSVVLIDCGLDLANDVQEGRAAVQPTKTNRFWLAVRGVREVFGSGGHDVVHEAAFEPGGTDRQPHDLAVLARMAYQHSRLSRGRLQEPATARRAPALPLPLAG